MQYNRSLARFVNETDLESKPNPFFFGTHILNCTLCIVHCQLLNLHSALLIAQPKTQAVKFTALIISKGIENEFYGC